jgi:hypothetical protein
MTMNQIFEYIWESAHYHNIMDNYLGRYKTTLKPDLLSEIYIYWSKDPKKIEDIFNRSEREFGAYFNATVRNNVVSTSSPFYKNCIKTLADGWDEDFLSDEKNPPESSCEIEEKILKEIKLEQIKKAMLRADLSWFERQLFLEYYYTNKKISYQTMCDRYGLNKSYLYKLLRNVKQKIKSNL